MAINPYGTSIKKYIDVLPTTNVLIVYFTPPSNVKKDIEPHIADDVRIMKVGAYSYFVNTSPSGNWTKVYRREHLRCLIGCNDTEITGVTAQFTDVFEQIAGADKEGIIGNHLTIGVKHYAKTFRLNTHTTIYVVDPESPSQFDIQHPTECTIPLLDPITPATLCVLRHGQTIQCNLFDSYKNELDLVPVIQHVQDVMTNTIQVGSGPRGGKFLVVGGKKRYIQQTTTMHGGRPSNQELIDMIYDKFVRHVMQACEADQKSVVASMIYEIEEHSQGAIFRLDLEQITMAYEYEHQVRVDAARAQSARNKRKRDAWELMEQQKEHQIQIILGL